MLFVHLVTLVLLVLLVRVKSFRKKKNKRFKTALITSFIILLFDVINFEINLIKSFFYITKKARQKFKYLEKKKELLRWNKEHLSSFLKGFHLPRIASDLRVRLQVKPFRSKLNNFWNSEFELFIWNVLFWFDFI